MPDAENFLKVSGYSFEDIIAVLENNAIQYKIHSKPRRQRCFFHASDIELSSIADQRKLSSLLRYMPSRAMGVDYYYALYEIPSMEYMRTLDGNIRFKKGKLVEQIRVGGSSFSLV